MKKIKPINKKLNPLKRKIILSITSYPKRFSTLAYTLYSLFLQSYKPDKIVLFLGKEFFKNGEEDIPENLLRFKDFGLEIVFCSDMKSYTKLIPALLHFPHDIIVTADDDIYYPQNWLKMLISAYKKHPNFIHCHRAHVLTLDSHYFPVTYNKFLYCKSKSYPSFFNFFTGVGGVLYPPHSLFYEVSNQKLFMRYCPKADDIWFWAMALLQKTKISVIPNGYTNLIYTDIKRELRLTDDTTLATENVIYGKNDQQFRNVFEAFNLAEILRQENLKRGIPIK